MWGGGHSSYPGAGTTSDQIFLKDRDKTRFGLALRGGGGVRDWVGAGERKGRVKGDS